jgi:hypothetical protein
MSTQTIVIIVVIVALIAVLASRRSGPRVTHIDRTVRKEKDDSDA